MQTRGFPRRQFLTGILGAAAVPMLGSTLRGAELTTATDVTLAKPSPQQLAFMDMEFGSFHHFGINTFSGQEHGDGLVQPAVFNPTTRVEPEQWVLAAKAMGAKYCVMTARHEEGFCLWPTQSTDYNIKFSPYQGGHGDIVRDFTDACRKHGLKPGLYHPAGTDAHHARILRENGRLNMEKYIHIQLAQLTELFSNYGDLYYLWCDHWGGGGKLWGPVYELMQRLQPHCIMMGPDTWLTGTESGFVGYPLWNATDTKDGTRQSRPVDPKRGVKLANNVGLLETDVTMGDPHGKFWRNRECDTNSGFYGGCGWFWHPDKNPKPRPLADHVDLYYRTIGLGANLIVNLPPNQAGLIPDNLVDAAKAMGNEIDRRFSKPLAESTPQPGDVCEIAWSQPTPVNTVVLMEDIKNGQRIAAYTLEAEVDGKWQPLVPANHFRSARPPFNANPRFNTVGHKKIDRIKPVVTQQLRFRCVKKAGTGPVSLQKIAAFNVTEA